MNTEDDELKALFAPILHRALETATQRVIGWFRPYSDVCREAIQKSITRKRIRRAYRNGRR